LLIGLNDYAGRTARNVGSRQDAEELRNILLKLGWRKDHIMLIVDLNGNASHVIDAIRSLASKTNSSSTVFSITRVTRTGRERSPTATTKPRTSRSGLLTTGSSSTARSVAR
jgi:hypothetical protein